MGAEGGVRDLAGVLRQAFPCLLLHARFLPKMCWIPSSLNLGDNGQMQFTKSAQEAILNMARESPLQGNEYRRIEGLGQMYLVLEETPEDGGYTTLVTVRLDGIPHRICRRVKRDV